MAANKETSVGIKLITDLRQYQAGFSKAAGINSTYQKSVKKMAGSVTSNLKNIAAGFLAAFSVRAIINFAKNTATAWDIQEKAEIQLLTALKGRKDVQESLIKQAQQLQKKTLFGDEETIRAQALIAAFVKEENQIKTIIPLVQDLATAKKMDLAGASDLVAKTLGSSTNALARYGIKVEGAVGSAQRLTSLQNGLNDAFGGQAEAAAKVGTAAMTQLNNDYGDLKETIGELILFQENQQGSFTKIMAENTRSLSGFISKINELNEAGSDTTNSILIQLLVRIGIISQKAVDARIAMNKAQKELISEMDSSVESSAPQKLYDKKIKTISILSEELKTLNDDLNEIDITDKKAIATQKQKIADIEKQIKLTKESAESYKYQLGTIGYLDEKISKLNETLTNTNSNDIKSIQLISEKIKKIEALKKAVAGYSAPDFRTNAPETIFTKQATTISITEDKKNTFDPKKLDGVSTGLSSLEARYKALQEAQANALTPEAFQAYQAQLEITGLAIDQFTGNVSTSYDLLNEKQKALVDSVSGGFAEIGTSIAAGLGLAQNGFEGFLSGLVQTTIKLISIMLSQSLANSIAGATASGAATGPGAIFTTPAFIATAVGGVLSAFAAIPKFASGGIVPGNSLTNDRVLIRANSGEEILKRSDPRHSLNGGIGGGESIINNVINLDGETIYRNQQKVARKVNQRT